MSAVPGYESDLTLGPITKSDSRRLFGGGSTGHTRPLVSRNPREMFIGVSSFDPNYMKTLEATFHQIDDILKPAVDPATGFSKNGAYESSEKGLCPSGYVANPMSYTPISNRLIRASLGLCTTAPAIFDQIVSELSSIVFEEADECDINVTPGSSTSFSGFRHDADWKIDYATFTFTPDRFATFLDLTKTDELKFSNEFETAYAYTCNKRDQQDRVGKQRKAWGIKHARDPEGFPDDWCFMDKKVVMPDGTHWDLWSASRPRLINAGPWNINSIIAPVAAMAQKSMFRRFPNVWHINTPEQLEAAMKGKFVFHGDVGQFDVTHLESSMDRLHDGAREWWASEYVDVAEKLLYAPYFARPLSLDGKPEWVGQVFSGKREVVCGNRSGHAWTSLYNKILMVAAILYACHLAGYRVLGNVRSWLLGQMPITFVNNGDDSVIMSKNKAALDLVIKYLTDVKYAIYSVTREDGGVYNGMTTILLDADKLIYRCQRNFVNSLIKKTSAEKSIYNPRTSADLERDLKSRRKIFRKYWYIGVAELINHASEDPIAEVVVGSFLENWSKHMRGYLSIPEMLRIARERVPLGMGDLTQAEHEVLEDPRKLHYKWDREDIRPHILNEVTSKVPFEAFAHIIPTYYKGKFVHKGDLGRVIH